MSISKNTNLKLVIFLFLKCLFYKLFKFVFLEGHLCAQPDNAKWLSEKQSRLRRPFAKGCWTRRQETNEGKIINFCCKNDCLFPRQ